jgi:hypothetical protein
MSYVINLDAKDWSNAIMSSSISPHDVKDACMSNAIISAFKTSLKSYKPNMANGIRLEHAF